MDIFVVVAPDMATRQDPDEFTLSPSVPLEARLEKPLTGIRFGNRSAISSYIIVPCLVLRRGKSLFSRLKEPLQGIPAPSLVLGECLGIPELGGRIA